MSTEQTATRRIVLKIGPASMRWGKPYVKVSGSQIGPIDTIDQLEEIVDDINNPITEDKTRGYLGCGTCEAAKWCRSEAKNELQLRASLNKRSTKISVNARCDVLVYAAKNGFVQDAACMKAKKPIYLIVGTGPKKPTWKDKLRTIFQAF